MVLVCKKLHYRILYRKSLCWNYILLCENAFQVSELYDFTGTRGPVKQILPPQ